MLDLYKQPGVLVFIHIPYINGSYAMNCLQVLRSYLDLLECHLSDFMEEWRVYRNKRDAYREWHYSQENTADWKNDRYEMADQIAFISIDLRYKEKDASGFVSLSATVKRWDWGHIPMTKDERKVFIHMTKRLWLLLDTTELLEITKQAVLILGASYACIDSNRIVPASIYTAPFRLCSENTHLIDPEERIPGIFWWQYISEKMIRAVSCTHEYLIKAPCDYSEIGYEHQAQGVCLQLCKKLSLKPGESELLAQKLQLRAYLEPFLYHPSIDLLLQYHNDPFTRYDFELMPMTQEEIRQLSIRE